MKFLLKSLALVATITMMAQTGYAQRDTTIINPPPPPPPTGVSTFDGYVNFQGSGRADRIRNARVQAIRLGLNENFTAVSETDSNGRFQFSMLPAGQYVIRASVNRAHPLFNSVLPTYQGRTIYWSRAEVITIPMRYDTSFFLYLTPRPVRSDSGTVRGNGVIRGRVLGGDSVYVGGRVNAARIAFNAQNSVLLLTGPNNFEATAFPEVGTGNYSFENLPAGNYTVSILYPKLQAITSVVAVAANTTSVIEFTANQPSNVTGIAKNITTVGNYPNPAQNKVTVLVEGLKNPTITLTGLNGAKFTAPFAVTAQGVELNLSQVKTGVYMVQVAEGNKLFTTKIVKN